MSWVGAGHIVGQAFWFGSLLLLAAMLSPAEIGTVTVGLLLVTAATRLMEAGTRGTIIVAETLTRQQVSTAFASNLAAGVGLCALIALASGPMAAAFAHGQASVLAALGMSVALYAPAIVPLALLEKRLEFKRRSGVQAGATIVASTAAVAAALLGAGVWALVIRQVLFQGLQAVLGWLAAYRFLPEPDRRAGAPRWDRLVRHGSMGFMLFSLTDFVVFNADYLAVGHYTNTAQLGLYSMAFTIAFAPVTQFSAQLGRILFPAVAASDVDTIRRRTVSGVKLTCLLLLPLIPITFVLSPMLIEIMGPEWTGMIVPLRILVVVGVAHAIVNVIGESLSGTGHIGFRARVNMVWMVGMVGALVVLVQADGIRGAALAHLALYVPVTIAYATTGMRLLGSEPRGLGTALRGVGLVVGLQTAVTFAGIALLLQLGVPELAGGLAAAALGLVAAGVVFAVRGRAAI